MITPTQAATDQATPDGCASCLSRRGFLTNSALAAAALAFLAACGDGQIGAFGINDPTGSVTIKVGDFADLATANKLVLVDSQRAVKRLDATTFRAFSRACTHEGTAVTLLNSSTTFFCPNHGSQFDNNGQVTVGPAGRALLVLTAAYDPVTDILTIG